MILTLHHQPLIYDPAQFMLQNGNLMLPDAKPMLPDAKPMEIFYCRQQKEVNIPVQQLELF